MHTPYGIDPTTHRVMSLNSQLELDRSMIVGLILIKLHLNLLENVHQLVLEISLLYGI